MLTASGLTHAFGDRELFGDVTVTLTPGRRSALVGANGTGKTTLLEILVGRRHPDGGEVHRSADLRVGYLPQQVSELGSGSVHDAVLAGAGEVVDLGRTLRDLEERMSRGEDVADAYGHAQSRFEQLGGYAVDAEVHRVLAGLGFAPGDAERPVAELSGGWRMRAGLARLLIGHPDVLVLDEPTNHLDVDSIAWLERHLAESTMALLFVSHDRDFIDAVATHVLELAGGRLQEYVGGFAEFVVEREERLERIRAAAANQAKHLAKTERFIERFRYKATKARQVQSRVKLLERLDRIEVPDDREVRARFAFPEPPRSSRVVAELEGADLGYDAHPVLSDVDLHVERGQRVALVGPNGAGKTTLLRALLGDLEPMRGTLRLGGRVAVAAFHQLQADELDPSDTVVQSFTRALPQTAGKQARTLLGAFGFPGDAADRRVGLLSGGERTRLVLGRLMVEPANLLVLDEPTNHLDLGSCDILEDALRAYAGTVLLVTHDRYLIRSVATDLIEVRRGSARLHHGVDEAILAPDPKGDRRPPTTPAPPAGPARTRSTRRRAAADERNRRGQALGPLRAELRQAERAWESAEARVAELQRSLAEPSTYDDPEHIRDLTRTHDRAKEAAETAMSEWERAAHRLEEAQESLA